MRVPEEAVPARLGLSGRDLADLETLADTVIEETLQAYDEYCVQADRGVDAKRWKARRHHGDLGLYTDRKEFRDASQKLRTADGLLVPVISRHSTPAVMVVGSFPGRLEDSLYGDLFDSTESARARLALIKDHFEDVRVVHQIRGPTEDEPFRFCGIVWASLGASARPFTQQRDVCILVSSGLAYTKSGVPFGYTVHHSVSLAELRPLTELKLVRAKMSHCCLKRQLDDDTVEVYHRGFFAPMGSANDGSATKSFFASMLTVPAQTIDAALAKKLDWMHRHSRGRKRTLVFDQACAGRCQTRFGASNTGTCVVCRSPVCGSCKEVKKTATDPADVAAGAPRLTAFTFCVVCVNMARRKSSDVFATREVHRNTTGSAIWSQSDEFSAREQHLDMDDSCSLSQRESRRSSQRSSQRSTQKISIS